MSIEKRKIACKGNEKRHRMMKSWPFHVLCMGLLLASLIAVSSSCALAKQPLQHLDPVADAAMQASSQEGLQLNGSNETGMNAGEPADNGVNAAVDADDPNPPGSPVKLMFIHHSTGENWLADGYGDLGKTLRDNNYFVSDTNYGWGPDAIGDRTDIGHWWSWFRSAQSSTYMAALLSESEQHCSYSRLADDPGGANEIVMFKSCFPNSALQGNPDDPVPDIGSNPLKGESSGSEHHTVANAKGIYIDLLSYFRTRPDVLFLVVTAPPLSSADLADNARAFNQWLMEDWLKDYDVGNVFVLDFYNVLTTNGGNPNTNDLNKDTGNHHRWRNGAVSHEYDGVHNTLAYKTSDDHPSKAGSLKASSELVPLINVAYNRWKQGIPSRPLRPDGPSELIIGEEGDYATMSTDPAGRTIKYIFSWGDGATSETGLHHSGEEVSSAHSWNAEGQFLVKVQAVNDEEKASSWSDTLQVRVLKPNSPPSVPSLPSGSYTVTKGKAYTYTASSIDPDGDKVKIVFDWGDGTTDETGLVKSGTKVKAAHIWAASGQFALRAKAVDEHGAESDWSKVVTVVNNPPSKPSTPAGPSRGSVGQELAFSTSSKDPEGDDIKYLVDYGDGTTEETDWYSSGVKVTLHHAYEAKGTWSIKVMAIDQEDAKSAWSTIKRVTIT